MPSPSDVIAGRLVDGGIRAIFGVPGGGNLELIDAAARAGLPFVLTATETGGALAAMAQAEISGRPAACLTTLGPGAASVANGVACAFLDRAPLLVFTDAQAVRGHDAFEHQHFDHRALFAPITRWSVRLAPDRAAQTIEQAIAAAVGPPPGPVHIDCPGDGDASAAEAPGRPSPAISGGRDAEALASLVARARRPLVIAGLGACGPGDAAAIRAFVERRMLPAMVTYKGKGVVPDLHPCFAGVFTHARIEQGLIERSDLVIGVGLDPVELLPRGWTYPQPVVYVGRWRVADNHVPFAVQQVAGIADGLAAIDSELGDCQWDPAAIRSHVGTVRHAVDIPTAGMSAQRVVAIAAERLAAEACVTVDAGAHMLPITTLWPVAHPHQMLISNGLSTMGFALPAAIGAALLDRTRPVVALTGDGGLLMCAGELLTAAREKLRMMVLVFNDASLSLIEIKQQRKGYRPAGVALGAVSWRSVAEGFGIASFEARDERALARAIDDGRKVDGPCLIDARIDRSNYGQLLQAIRG